MDLGAWANEEYRVPVKEDLNPGETSEKSLKPAPTKDFKDVPMV